MLEPSTIIIILLVTYSAVITFLLFVYEGIVRRQRYELGEMYTTIFNEVYRVLSEDLDEKEVEENNG